MKDPKVCVERREFLVAGAAAGLLAGVATTTAGAKGGLIAGRGRGEKFKLGYAPHFGMFANHAKDDLDQLRFAAEQGFAAWEDNGMRGRGEEFQKKAGAVMAEVGIRMGVFVGADIDWGNPTLTTGKKEHLDRFVANVRDSVEVAKRLNAKWCTIVPGVEARNVPQGQQTAHVIEAMKRACGECEKSGLVMVIEPLNWRDHPGQFVRYSDHAYTIMKGVGHPCCKILFDLYHQQASEGNLIENFERYWDEVAYFQVGDNPGRCEPGTGEINYRNVFKRIGARGFTGILGMEHGNSRGGKAGELAVIEAYQAADAG